jgi:hypothetical protein
MRTADAMYLAEIDDRAAKRLKAPRTATLLDEVIAAQETATEPKFRDWLDKMVILLGESLDGGQNVSADDEAYVREKLAAGR